MLGVSSFFLRSLVWLRSQQIDPVVFIPEHLHPFLIRARDARADIVHEQLPKTQAEKRKVCLNSVHLNPEMAQFTFAGLARSIVSRFQCANSVNGIVAQLFERVRIAPRRIWFGGKVTNPATHFSKPVGRCLILHIANHCGEFVTGSMMTEFEPLDAARRALLSDDILAFVSILLFRRGQPLALDWKERIELAVSSVLDEDRCGPRFDREIDLSSSFGFIARFSAELDVAPNVRLVGGAVEVVAEMFRQSSFGLSLWPVRVVTPTGQFQSNEINQFQLRRGWQMNLPIKGSCLDVVGAIGNHPCEASEPLLGHIRQGFIRITQSHGAEPVAEPAGL